jgi:hypothetical protein
MTKLGSERLAMAEMRVAAEAIVASLQASVEELIRIFCIPPFPKPPLQKSSAPVPVFGPNNF